jgi:tetratricopeptide (TPR) repeat protein
MNAQARQSSAAGHAADGSPPPPHKPDFRIRRAQAAWQQRRYNEAIWFYERALARDPHNAVLLVDVARAYVLRFRYADAEKLIELAETLYPDDAHLQEMLGRSYAMTRRFDRSIACYRRSLELVPANPQRAEILWELSKMYERLHDLDSARACAEEALSLAPRFNPARYTLANIYRRSGDTAKAESLWREVIATAPAPKAWVADSWYQLAALHDQAGLYAEAFAEATCAKKIFEIGSAPYEHEARIATASFSRDFRVIEAEHCERWQAARKELNQLGGGVALLCSHPRSGTTLLEQVLDSHPGVISADEIQIMSEVVHRGIRAKGHCGELSIDGPDGAPKNLIEALDRLSTDDVRQLRHDYWVSMEGAMQQPIGERMLLDKNPDLTTLLPLVARIFPDMRIIFALRDPRDVVISCFMLRLPLNHVSIYYLTLEATAKKYANTMSAWFNIRDKLRNPWLYVRYEDTVADLEGQARKTLDFLGLPWDAGVLEFHRRAQKKHVHSPTYEAVTKPVYTSSIGRWKNYAEQLKPCMQILQPFVEAFGYA